MKIKTNIPLKIREACKWLGKEIISGLVVAAAVAVGTQSVLKYSELEKEKEKLKSMYLGLSKQYVESILGVPIVETNEGEGMRSYYKLTNSVVSCAYRENQVMAFFVFVQSDKELYQIPYNIYITEPTYLTKFSYSQFSNLPENYKANCPANNDDFAYYTETYYGANPAQYNYFIIGSYKNHFDDTYIPLISHSNSEEFYGSSEHEAVRKKAKPNVFGMIEASYIDEIEMLPFNDEALQVHCSTIFSGFYR